MAFLIFILCIGLFGKALHSAGVWNRNFRLIAMSELSALLFGPTVYLFFTSILLQRQQLSKNIIHYIPGVVYSTFILVYFIIPPDIVIISRRNTGELRRAIYTCHAVGLTVNIIYGIMSWKLLYDFRKNMQNELSYVPKAQFVTRFLIIISSCFIVWSILYVTSLFGFEMLERNARPYLWLLLTFIILFITYYGMVYPDVLQIGVTTNEKKYSQSKLKNEDLDRLKQTLDDLMIEKKPYLNNKLLKAELASMLGVSNPELARLLNERIGMNFFEYVNYYRIKEFIEVHKSERAKQLTFYGMAQESGFNSKTTFNKSFKKLMGQSPSDYFNQKT
ncbi:hypothetical protein GCM10022393_43040 [Aquimarina addita]|uniref:HTH araC/xylS-type domain-containing protein n=1 Tax=Aquimarina addita TaxID=870485 RepID=A0ABP6UWJ8_9FLAO